MQPIVYNNTIPLDTCLNVVASGIRTGNDVSQGLAIVVLLFAIMVVAIAIAWVEAYKEQKLAKDYLRRRNALTEFENWKRDRRVE